MIHPLLKKILDTKAEEVRHQKRAVPLGDMRRMAASAPATRPFAGGILACGSTHKVIAEIKRISPGNAQFRREFDPVAIAKGYEAAGAAALSVLTDTIFFGGSLSCLALARDAVSIPVLRKDFIVDPYQVYEARAHGADAVLLMAVNFASKTEFHEMIAVAQDAGIETLLEVHDEGELEYLPVSRQSVGINNRNFKDKNLAVDTDTTKRLAKMVKNARLLVSESGIRDSHTMSAMEKIGVDAFLVGTSLMKENDPGATLAHLLAH